MSNFLGSVQPPGSLEIFSAERQRISRSVTLSIPSEYTLRTVIYAIVVGKH